MSFYAHYLWGKRHNLDYHTACEREPQHVDAAERRAVDLLATICDHPRRNFYLYHGTMPAMGNRSKKIYLVKREGGVNELDDGRVTATWCIGVGAHAWQKNIPPTDNVIALKMLIEGSEDQFERIGNRTVCIRSLIGEDETVYTTAFLSPGITSLREARGMADYAPIRRHVERQNQQLGICRPVRLPDFADGRHANDIRQQMRRLNPQQLQRLRGVVRENQRHQAVITAEFARHNREEARIAIENPLALAMPGI